MPQPSTVEAVHQVGGRTQRPSDLALVIIECHVDDRDRVYRGLAELPCRPVLIEEPAAMR